MPSTAEQLSPTRTKLTVQMPFEDLRPAIDQAYKSISEQVNMPGFRKGKIPPRLIDQRFGRGTVLQEAINNALPDAYAKAVSEHDLYPLGQPEIEVTRLEDGEVVEFTAEVDVRPDFDLPDPSLVRVEVAPATVSEEEVDERIELLRQRFATLTPVDRPAQDGDVVVFDLVARQNGVEVEDARSEGLSYRVGAGGMVDGLDEALRGMSAEETKQFTSTLIGGPHRGEEADIEVTVHRVQEQNLPALDDDFAQLVSEFDTFEEMRADLREGMERMARIGQANEARDKVLETYLDMIDLELPESLVQNQQQAFRQNIENQLAQAGMTLDEYLAEAEDEEHQTAEEFWADVEKNAATSLRAQVVLDKLAEERQFTVSQEDLTQLIINKAQENGTTPEQETQHMIDHNHLSEWMGEVRRGKALGLLTEQAQIVDTEGNPVDLSRLMQDGTYAEVPAESTAQGDADTTQQDVANNDDVASENASAPVVEDAREDSEEEK